MSMTIYELCTRVATDLDYVKTHLPACQYLYKALERQLKQVEQKHNDPLTKTREKLKAWFEQWVDDHSMSLNEHKPTQAEKDFRIQYSYFEPSNLQYEPNIWYMWCTLPCTSDWPLYQCNGISYSPNDETNIEISSWKGSHDDIVLLSSVNAQRYDYRGNFYSFTIQDYNKRGQSTEDRIYLVDLYPEFQPRHFEGECWTRGTWMHIDVSKDEATTREY